MRAIAGIIAVARVGVVACTESTTVERQAVAQVAQQAQADHVSVLAVEGMT